jgi:hypothetical protein
MLYLGEAVEIRIRDTGAGNTLLRYRSRVGTFSSGRNSTPAPSRWRLVAA